METQKLKLWVCALAIGSIASLASADITTDLVGYWRLDDGSGATAIDSSGNGNHGTLINSPEWQTAGDDVRVGSGAIEFDFPTDGSTTSSDYVDCGNKPEFNITDHITLALWVKSDGFRQRYQYFFSKDIGGGGYSVIRNAETRNCRVVFNGLSGQYYATGSTVIDDGQWHHLAASYDISTGAVAFYTDGLLEVSETASGSIPTNDLSLHIGGRDVRNCNAFIDDVRIYNRTLSADDIMELYLYQGFEGAATIVAPGQGATDVPRDVILSWRPGKFAARHDVYLGTTFDDVNDADRANPMDVLPSQGQDANSYDAGVLAFGQTYYWRVDEVNAAPDNTIFKGAVWSFTVEPLAYPIEGVIATSNAAAGAENTVNGSGLNADDEHSTEATDMFLGVPDADPIYLQYEFDNVYKLHEMLAWNYNVQFELLLGFGIKDVTVEYSENGTDWTVLGDAVLAQATAQADYLYNTTIDFGGVAARYVKLTVNSGYGMVGQYGLSEVRFMFIPTQAREPQPDDGATDMSVDTTLGWRAGRDAISHDVYFGTDSEALPLADTVDTPSYSPGVLDLGTTYYWKIDEVQDAESWEGAVWSFSTQAYLVVEDFESYDDDENRIYDTWVDGYGVNDNGSQVGHIESPFAETSIVNGGSQSMPLFYDNTGAAISEAEFALAQDWTASGVKSLILYFQGAEGNGGQLYVKINGTKIAYDGAASDITEAMWLPWNIDLSAVGGNLSNVTSLTIGIEGAGASGVVYIDDIRLYP